MSALSILMVYSKMKSMSLALITLLILAGCSMPNTKKGDGREWLEVSCSGFSDWTKCHEKASRLCPNGYDMGNKEESVIAQKRLMQFACK